MKRETKLVKKIGGSLPVKKEEIEKYSAAITLSDMEIFVFPELLYSLLLANLMSPVIWGWLDDPWFNNINTLKPYRRILKLKQYIIDHYDFNLDLETWGLTTKETEIDRFNPYISEDVLSKSNALFGYEGDKYYFDIEIRKHFGIEKYQSNVIPYWKTETVEAMNAFKYKTNHTNGAGECVSLSALYAAALFVVCKIPLDDIYLLATPLHSQNFVDIADGLLTNNRRIVTKNMWFNGTELITKAQRALRNEQVTIISHNSGFIHVAYPEATIDRKQYNRLKEKLNDFLKTEINSQIFYNFLRQESQFQKCFQLKSIHNGKERYLRAERAYAYEHTSNFRMNTNTRDKLFAEMDEYEFFAEPMQDRISLNDISDFLDNNPVTSNDDEWLAALILKIQCPHTKKKEILDSFFEFCQLTPKLPDENKHFVKSETINITIDMDRDDIISYLESTRDKNKTVDLSFYAYRDFSRTGWDPFIKAAIERNPVSIEGSRNLSDAEVRQALENMDGQSIYEGPRLAQPDEVWNYQRGDGLEKALCLANILLNRNKNLKITIVVGRDFAEINIADKKIKWPSNKGLEGTITIPLCSRTSALWPTEGE